MEALEIILNSSLLVALVGVLYKFYELRKKKQKPFTDALTVKSSVRDLLELFRLNNNLSRVCLLKGEDGGRPNAESKFYSSVIEEVTANGLTPAKDTWQRQVVDDQYEKLLAEMMTKPFVITETEKMKPSMLKDIYVKNGVAGSVTCVITENSKRMIYVSFHFSNLSDVTTSTFRDNLRIFKNNLRKIFK